MKPLDHAISSAKKFGGKPDDYIAIHQYADHSKAAHATNVHRILLHHSLGIFVLESVFGKTITNSDGRIVHVRDIGEQHVLEDLNFIPSLSDWCSNILIKPWMNGGAFQNPELLPPGYSPAVRPRTKFAAPVRADDHAD